MVARRAVPTPTPRPAPPPKRPAKPLVRVRGRKKKAARKLAQSSSPLVTTNSVEVRLELTAEDTFDTYRLDDIEYRRPFFQRALMPAVIVLLLLVLGWQTATQLGLLDGSSETTLGAMTTLTDICRSEPLVKAYPALARAVASISAPVIPSMVPASAS